mmetsp:Transcript_6300/g.9570  ORF Transcript_6300/g.9570 Transcript_6300/m.9570 type:complete len:346 (-) Transcript_6300:212-1249(-)
MILHTGDNHELELEGEEESCFPSALSFAFLAIEFIVLIYRVYRVAIRYFAQPTSRNKSIKIPALSLIVISIWMVQDIPIEYFECVASCSISGNAEKICFLGICFGSLMNYSLMSLKFKETILKSQFLCTKELVFLHYVFQGMVTIYAAWACLTAFVFASINGECGTLHIPFASGVVLMVLDLLISLVGLYIFSVPVSRIQKRNAAMAPVPNNPACNCDMRDNKHKSKRKDETSSVVFWNLVGVGAGQVSTQVIMFIFTFFCSSEESMGTMEASAPLLNVIAVAIMFRDHIHAFDKIAGFFYKDNKHDQRVYITSGGSSGQIHRSSVASSRQIASIVLSQERGQIS